MQNENLRKGREKLAQMRAAGTVPERTKTPSKAQAIVVYFRQHHGVDENRGSIVKQLREDAQRDVDARKKRAAEIGYAAVIAEICWKCEAGDSDPNAGARIAACTVTACAINPVRPMVAIRRPPTLDDHIEAEQPEDAGPVIDINSRCRIKSDRFQWMAQHRRNDAEEFASFEYYRTIGLALDALKAASLCSESDLAAVRSIAAQLAATTRQADSILAGKPRAPIPPQAGSFDNFMTCAGAINSWFLKQVWGAASTDEIPALAKKAVSLAEISAQTAKAAP
jgi:hypothetical protein